MKNWRKPCFVSTCNERIPYEMSRKPLQGSRGVPRHNFQDVLRYGGLVCLQKKKNVLYESGICSWPDRRFDPKNCSSLQHAFHRLPVTTPSVCASRHEEFVYHASSHGGRRQGQGSTVCHYMNNGARGMKRVECLPEENRAAHSSLT